MAVVPVVSVWVGVVVSVFGFFGVGFERAGDEALDPVGGVDGCGTTVVVATAAPGAGLDAVAVSRVLVTDGDVVTEDGFVSGEGFVCIVVFAAVAIVSVGEGIGAAVLVMPALLVVATVPVVSVVALVVDSLRLQAAPRIATRTNVFRIVASSSELSSTTPAGSRYADAMQRVLAAIALLVAAAFASAAPHVQSVAERRAVVGGTLTLRIPELASLPCKSLILYLDGTPIRGLGATCKGDEVRFTLARNSQNIAAWRTLFTKPRGFSRKVSVSVGSTLRQQLPTKVVEHPLTIVRGWRITLVIFLTLIALTAVAFVRLRTELLTNLPRLQIAYFLVIIGAAYGWLWSTTGELATLNATALALLGIGAGTALGDAALGTDNRVSVRTAGERIAGAAQNGVAAPVETQVVRGVHSLQAGACTLIFGIVFLASVYRNAEMPAFGQEELLLLGISGGTYIAFAFAPSSSHVAHA